MEKNKKRAERRKAEAKKLRDALNVAKNIFRYPKNFPDSEKWQMEWARRHANNLKKCSCWMCCSPRENGELTIQEK
jgi:hypothetical protein